MVCRGGDWKTGGSCHLETLPDLTPPESLEEWDDLLKPVNDVLGNNLRPKLSGIGYAECDTDDSSAERRPPLGVPKPFRTRPSLQTGLQPLVPGMSFYTPSS